MSATDVPDADERVEQRVPERLLLNVREVAELHWNKRADGLENGELWRMTALGVCCQYLATGRRMFAIPKGVCYKK